MTRTDFLRPNHIRALAWGGAAILILLPLMALKIADPLAWEWGDLPFAFVMIAAVGVAFEVALRLPAVLAYRAGAGLALATACMLIWGNLAVGFAGSEDNRINLLFFAVPVVALAGSLIARFRSAGMVVAMASTAAAQVLAGLIAFADGHFTGPLTISFTGLWLATSLLFWRSSRERASTERTS